MPYQRVTACDTPQCLALYLAPPPLGLDAVRAAAIRNGWTVPVLGPGMKCPACTLGRTPVLERGECPRCMGTCFDRADGAVCHYCGHVTPHPHDDEDQEQGEPEQEPTGEARGER